MTITEEELQRIVAAAVKVALNEIKGTDQPAEQPENNKVDIHQFTDDELDEAMRVPNSEVSHVLRCMKMFGKKNIIAKNTKTTA